MRAVRSSMARIRAERTCSSRSSTRVPATAASSGAPLSARSPANSAVNRAMLRVKCGSCIVTRPPRVLRRALPLAQRRPALRLEARQLGLAVRRSSTPGRRPRGPPANSRSARASACSQPVRSASPAQPPASRSASSDSSRGEPRCLAACCAAWAARTASRGRPASRARKAVLQKACASRAGVAADPGGGERLGVVRAGVVEAARVVRQPAHGDGEFAGAGVQPVGDGAALDAGVQQVVGGAQRLGGAAVDALRAVPVVQQPDAGGRPPRRRRPRPRRPGARGARRAGYGERPVGCRAVMPRAAAGPPVMNARRSTSLSSWIWIQVSRWSGSGAGGAARRRAVRAPRPRTVSRGAKPMSGSVSPGNMCRNTRS